MPMFQFNTLDDVVNKGLPVVKTPGAFMSPLQGGASNPFSVVAEGRDYVVVAHVKINGFKFGMFMTNEQEAGPYPHKFQSPRLKNNHAEDAFLCAFHEAMFYSNAMVFLCGLSLVYGKKVSFTMKSSKSPCPDCASKLINFMKTYDGLVAFRIKTVRQYGGGKKVDREGATTDLANSGIPIIPLNLPKKTSERDYDKNRYGHEHEYSALDYDPEHFDEKSQKSFLTEQINAFHNNELDLMNILGNADAFSVNSSEEESEGLSKKDITNWYKSCDKKRFDRKLFKDSGDEMMEMLRALVLDLKSGRLGAGNLLSSVASELRSRANM